MFIQTEATPNPATLKFIPGKSVAPGPPREYRSPGEAAESPLALRLFEVEGVTGVFSAPISSPSPRGRAIGSISSRRCSASSWSIISPALR